MSRDLGASRSWGACVLGVSSSPGLNAIDLILKKQLCTDVKPLRKIYYMVSGEIFAAFKNLRNKRPRPNLIFKIFRGQVVLVNENP